MRLDDVAPRTLVLGAVAAWAITAWVLAMAGMGGRVPGPDAGVIPPPSLPPMPRATAPALGPPGQYAETSARPLFATDRRPRPFFLQGGTGEATQAPAFDLVLTSVLITPQANIAIVQKPDGSASWRVRVGDAPADYPGWQLTAIAPRSATFVGPEGEKTLALRVFDGRGGSAPTAIAPPQPPVEVPGPVPAPGPGPGAAPTAVTQPATDASTPDPEQIEAIRRRIEARREQMRRNAQNANPPASVAPAPPPPTR